MHETNESAGSELVPLAAIIDLGDRKVYEERLVPAEAAEAIENGEQIVAWTDLDLVVRYELDAARTPGAAERGDEGPDRRAPSATRPTRGPQPGIAPPPRGLRCR